jgi:hypothetical protein
MVAEDSLRTELETRLLFETLIADLSSKFINLPAEQVDREIEDAQRQVCECLGLDLAALWQWSSELPNYFKMTHLYRPLGGPPVPKHFDAQEMFPWCLQEVVAGRIIRFRSVEEAPAAAARDVETWRHYGVKSILCIPLSAGGGPSLGTVSFHTVMAERAWPEEIVQRLHLVAQIFANALARKQAEACSGPRIGRGQSSAMPWTQPSPWSVSKRRCFQTTLGMSGKRSNGPSRTENPSTWNIGSGSVMAA